MNIRPIVTPEQEKEACSPYGNDLVELTGEHLALLLAGYTLADFDYDEYGLFIKLKI